MSNKFYKAVLLVGIANNVKRLLLFVSGFCTGSTIAFCVLSNQSDLQKLPTVVFEPVFIQLLIVYALVCDCMYYVTLICTVRTAVSVECLPALCCSALVETL